MNRHHNNTNALLVEIMIAVLFFSLCTTALLQSFAKIHQSSELSSVRTTAMVEARSLLERLNASETMDGAESVLLSSGFSREEDGWTKGSDGFTCTVAASEAAEECGTLLTFRLDAVSGETQLFTLNGASYAPAEVE